MSGGGQIPSWSQRIWSLAFALLGLAIAVQMVWAILAPLLPIIVVIGMVVGGVAAWNAWRWR